MAGRSEMITPEALMRRSDFHMVELHVANLAGIEDSTASRTVAEQNKLLGEVALTARRINGSLALSCKAEEAQKARVLARAQAAQESAKAQSAGDDAANENQVHAQQEQEMDDEPAYTSERAEQLYADIDRRLAALAARREAKGSAWRQPARVAGEPARDAAHGAPGTPKPAA